MSLAILLFAVAVSTADQFDTLVICPRPFQSAMGDWIEYREEQGYRIAMIDAPSTAQQVRSKINRFAEFYDLQNIVLVGDAMDANLDRSRWLPTSYLPAKVNVLFGSEPTIATDHMYVDLDQDSIVEFNIGRIPIDSEDELSEFIQRVIDYESDLSSGTWQKRINLVAGVGGFGRLLDKIIEQSVKKLVTDLIPAEYDLTMTYGSWRSPYCPDPRRFSEITIKRLNEGCLFWVYVGHGHRQRLDQVRLPDRQYRIFDESSVNRLNIPVGSPIAILLSCYTASVDDSRDGLGELMIKQPNGPIAVISSTRVSMPYAMGIFSLELMEEYFDGHAKTLGELISRAKRRMVQFDEDRSEYHRLLNSLGKSLSPDPELLDAERKEHVHLMHLLGDPLLKLPRPQKMKLNSVAKTVAGSAVDVAGSACKPGVLTIDLSYRRDRFRERPPRRIRYLPTPSSFDSYQNVYQKTQNLVSQSVQQHIGKGPFKINIDIPENCSGECHIRAMLRTADACILGSTNLFVDKPQRR